MIFAEYFCQKAMHQSFEKPLINADVLEKSMMLIVKYVQKCAYGNIISLLVEKSPDAFDDIIKRCEVAKGRDNQGFMKELRALKKIQALC